MNITLNLNPIEASNLHRILKTVGSTPTIVAKLTKHAHKFPETVATETVVSMVADTIEADLRVMVGEWTSISKKIAAIKALREIAAKHKLVNNAMGLADAKWAIENWGTFIDFVRKNNRLPQDGYYTWGTGTGYAATLK